MSRILVVVSDIKLQISLKLLLAYKGFEVTSTRTLTEARLLLNDSAFGLILLDIHNQDENAFNFIRSLRDDGCFSPVIYLGERSYKEVLVRNSTELDEYLLRPFGLSDLNSTTHRALLKSYSGQMPLLYGGIQIDEKRLLMTVREKIISLGAMEIKIITLLARKAGKIVSIDHLYGLDGSGIFGHISALRRKLEEAGIDTLRIHFINDGYRLEVGRPVSC